MSTTLPTQLQPMRAQTLPAGAAAESTTRSRRASNSSTCAVADDDGDDSRSVYSDHSFDNEEQAYYEEDTRDKYARLAARGRAAELAYNRKLEREERERKKERERSTSRSRSRPTTPLHSLFSRRDSTTTTTTSSSRPVTPKSGLSLLKFVPISRSSSSKSISGSNAPTVTTPGYSGSSGSSAAGSSVPSSPFASPKTPHSPLPFFLSTPKRRKSYAVPSPREDIPPLIEGVAGIMLAVGEPLTRTPRRTSPPPMNRDTPSTVRPSRRYSNNTTSRYAQSVNNEETDSSGFFGSPLARTKRRASPGRVHSLD